MYPNVTCHDISFFIWAVGCVLSISKSKLSLVFLPTDGRRTKIKTLPYIPKQKNRYGYVNNDKGKDLLYQLHKQKEGNWNRLPATPGSPSGPAGPEISETEE